jgi:hypothetical protein
MAMMQMSGSLPSPQLSINFLIPTHSKCSPLNHPLLASSPTHGTSPITLTNCFCISTVTTGGAKESDHKSSNQGAPGGAISHSDEG